MKSMLILMVAVLLVLGAEFVSATPSVKAARFRLNKRGKTGRKLDKENPADIVMDTARRFLNKPGKTGKLDKAVPADFIMHPPGPSTAR